jgi:hypothetical protein
MGVKINGIDKAIRGFEKLEREMPEAAQTTVDRSIGELAKLSRVQIPKKTGALVGTGREVVHSGTGYERSSGWKYGEPGEGEGIIDYAAAVHEILKASHDAPTKAKYIEDPLVQSVPLYKKFGMFAARAAVRKAFR